MLYTYIRTYVCVDERKVCAMCVLMESEQESPGSTDDPLFTHGTRWDVMIPKVSTIFESAEVFTYGGS